MRDDERKVVTPDEVRAALQALLDEEWRLPVLFSGDSFELRLRVVAEPESSDVKLRDDDSWAVSSNHGRRDAPR